MINSADLDNFLSDMQHNCYHSPFVVYGDSAFRGLYNCIISAHRGTVANPLTQRQRDENFIMKGDRESIEWSFGLTSMLFKICNDFNLWKLKAERPYATEQLEVTYLLTNCYTCLNQNVVGAKHTFGCKSPALEQYLIPH